jgi:hypothetical protein
MPFNFYSFLIANMLAEREFEEKKVPNKDRSRQLGLVASLYSPGGGGGLGSSVLPAVLVQQTARREAEEAAKEAAKKAALTTASGTAGTGTSGTGSGTTGTGGGTTGTGGGTTGTGAAVVTRDEFQALTARVGALEGLFVDYPDVRGLNFKQARDKLKEFHLLMLDEVLSEPVDDEKQIVAAQIPEAKQGVKLLRGSIVIIQEEPPEGDKP